MGKRVVNTDELHDTLELLVEAVDYLVMIQKRTLEAEITATRSPSGRRSVRPIGELVNDLEVMGLFGKRMANCTKRLQRQMDSPPLSASAG